jgi:UDP-glucose 4-epimerase
MDLADSRVLVTGGAGLIGSHIVDQLVRLGAPEVIVLDNFTRGKIDNLAWALENGPIEIVEGDIREPQTLARVMQGVDIVFHQAGILINQSAAEPRLAIQVLIEGTYNVLEAAVNAEVKKVVAASSASVYGLADQFPTPETQHPYNNQTLYGAAKAFTEGLMRSFQEMYGLNYCALRYFNVYGPRMHTFGAYTEVLARWMDRIAANEPPLIYGDGKHTMDFVFVEDVARANMLASTSDVTDQAFNVASGVETSLNQLASMLLKVMDCDLEPEHIPERRVNTVPRRAADIRKAERMIGFTTQVSLEEGLRRLVRWWFEERTDHGGRTTTTSIAETWRTSFREYSGIGSARP